jgi:hypothetical protein
MQEISPSQQKSTQVPLGLKDAEAAGGEKQKQKQTGITRANATTVCF